MKQNPAIDIIVPTYNRPDDISLFIENILKQRYLNFKVIIIDDCSPTDISKLIPLDEKRIEYKRLGKNRGQSGARNVAIGMSKAEIIISLDDDAWFFEDYDSLQKVADYFTHTPKLGCLMFDIKTPDRDWIGNYNHLQEMQLIGTHITCGCAYNAELLKKINGFPEFFHSGAEESDVTFKILKSNYEIRFTSRIRAFHNYIASKRDNMWYRRLRYNTTRNDLLLVIMYYPSFLVLPYLFGKWISHNLYTLKVKRDLPIAFIYTFLAFFGALGMLGKSFNHRNALTKEQFNQWLRIRFNS